MRILYVGTEEPVAFAATELKRVLGRMDEGLEIALCSMAARGDSEGLWIGACKSLDVPMPEVDDPALDDGYVIDVCGARGVIAGVNPRCVLLGVYRYLRELGCAWVRPGERGEIIPKAALKGRCVHVTEAASYRHRGVCIEGANNYDHVTEMIKWLPKIGMNAYFNQFWTPFTFYDRWYRHEGNPLLQPEPVTPAEVDGFVRNQVAEVKRRGMLYHAAGHGWTCAPFGLDTAGWYPYEGELPEGYEALLAEVNGKRELHEKIPLNTNLCYTDPVVIDRMTGAIVDYCRAHPEVSYLHFWLADAPNCHCECEACKKKTPSDNYVELLNALDVRMTEAGVPARVVFLIYFDLMWSPVQSRIHNPDRFVLMFAPITRTYSTAYVDAGIDGDAKVAPFVYNKITLPRSVPENVAFLRAWQQAFSGDSFIFDYHLWLDHLRDVGGAQISEVLFKDMVGLNKLGLNGMVSCQAQRVFSPSSLPMLLMADALWDSSADYETCVTRHYGEMYGEDGPKVRAYLERLSALLDSVYMRHEKPEVSDQARHNFFEAAHVIDAFQAVINANLEKPLPCAVRRSYEVLQRHGELSQRLARALSHKAAGEKQQAAAAWAETADFARAHEWELNEVLDVYEFIAIVGECVLQSEVRWI